ncbi:MAG TPA: hypothetical protein VFI34_02785 [Candidatus Limnocylindrales bacterium]|nr:hypothetical protein [Candidatus Limnocylindrales bacterium]
MVAGGVVQAEFGTGIELILSGLKTWVETGEPLMTAEAEASSAV